MTLVDDALKAIETKNDVSLAWRIAIELAELGIFRFTPVRDNKRGFLSGWQKRSPSSVSAVKELAKKYPEYNYGIVAGYGYIIFDIDVAGEAALKKEIQKIEEILGSDIEWGFTVISGRGRYHIYVYAGDWAIKTRQLTDNTKLIGVGALAVGPGSINKEALHFDTKGVYTICLRAGRDDPRKLTVLSEETLEKLARARNAKSDIAIKFENLGSGEVLDLPNPPCIERLITRGAPTDQEYVQSNHTLARYIISSGLSDDDGAELAASMARNTTPEHTTSKSPTDRVYNFYSSLNSARSNPESNQFECSYVWGSRELCKGGLCDACKYKPDGEQHDVVQPDIVVKARHTALKIMEMASPLQKCCHTFAKHHAGDREVIEVVSLGRGCQAVLNSDGIQKAIDGKSGEGKTHAQRTATHITCTDAYLFDGDMSDKVIFYKDDLRDGMVFHLDDTVLSPPLQKAIQRSMSKWQERFTYETVHDGKVLRLQMPARIMWLMNTTTKTFSAQTDNRMVGLSVDESEEIDEETWRLQAEAAALAAPQFPIDFDVLVCREFIVLLQEEFGPFYVSIPWSMKIEWGAKANRRNFPLFLDMIRGHAALFCLQRPRVGNVIFATRDDFEYAKDLYKRLDPKQKFKLGGPQIDVLRALVSVKGHEISRNDIARKTGIPANTVYKILHGKDKDDDGLLGRIDELTFERVTKTYHDKDAGTSKGTTENLYVLGSHFNEFGLYDESDLVIKLPEDAESDIDYAHISSDFLTFPVSRNVSENDSAVLESDITDFLHTYTTQQQQTLTFPEKCVRGGTQRVDHKGVCVSDPPYSKPGNLEKSGNGNGDGAFIESEIDNERDSDAPLTFLNPRKVSPDFSVKRKHGPGPDISALPKRARERENANPAETYLRKCVAVIRSCKYAETQNKVSREHFPEYVQHELADELHLSSDESAAYWCSVCVHPDVVGSIEELYGKEV